MIRTYLFINPLQAQQLSQPTLDSPNRDPDCRWIVPGTSWQRLRIHGTALIYFSSRLKQRPDLVPTAPPANTRPAPHHAALTTAASPIYYLTVLLPRFCIPGQRETSAVRAGVLCAGAKQESFSALTRWPMPQLMSGHSPRVPALPADFRLRP